MLVYAQSPGFDPEYCTILGVVGIKLSLVVYLGITLVIEEEDQKFRIILGYIVNLR